MHSESELRDQLRGSMRGTESRIDPAAVIRKAKARRAPRQIAFGSVAVLAVAGFAVLGSSTLPSLFPMSSGASDSAEVSGPESPTSGLKGSEYGSTRPEVNGVLTSLCGESSVPVAPNSLGLTLTPSFPASAPADGTPVTGTVTLTNTGPSTVRGTTGTEPFLELARDGITVWHSNGASPSVGRLVALAPGESLSYPARFTPVECSSDDEVGDEFRKNLPQLAAGDVTLTATIQFIPDGAAAGEGIIVSGPVETITLR